LFFALCSYVLFIERNPVSADTAAVQRSTPTFSLTDLGMLLVVLIWGGNLTITRDVFHSIGPLPFVGMRFGAGLLLLVAIVYATGDNLRVVPSVRSRIIWLGLIGNTLYQLFFQIGLSLTSATHTALMLATAPIWIALIESFRGHERMSRAAWGGILLSFAGIALVLAGRGAQALDGAILGDVLVLLSAVCWAIYTLGAKPVLAQYSALKTTTLTMLSGTPILVLAGLPGMLGLSWGAVPLSGWVGLAYSAALSLVLAYVIWYSSVQKVGSVRTGIYANLVPVIGVAIAWAVGGEQVGLPQIGGAALILAGVWLTRR
jgi:drug/metabolite transporter (DMT)-like permease